MIYRSTDGSPMGADTIKARTTRLNRLNGAVKAQSTRLAVRIPSGHAGISVAEYIRRFDRANMLKPTEYACQNQNAHWGHYEPDTAVEVRDAA